MFRLDIENEEKYLQSKQKKSLTFTRTAGMELAANENRVAGAISSVLYRTLTWRSHERAGNLNKIRAAEVNVKALRTRYTDEFARVFSRLPYAQLNLRVGNL